MGPFCVDFLILCTCFIVFSLSLGILFEAFTYVPINYFRHQAEEYQHISAAYRPVLF